MLFFIKSWHISSNTVNFQERCTICWSKGLISRKVHILQVNLLIFHYVSYFMLFCWSKGLISRIFNEFTNIDVSGMRVHATLFYQMLHTKVDLFLTIFKFHVYYMGAAWPRINYMVFPPILVLII